MSANKLNSLSIDQISVCRKCYNFSSIFFVTNIIQRSIYMCGIGPMDQATSWRCSWHFTRKCHPQVEPLLGSYTNRSHNFWMSEIKPVICTYLCFLQMFSIFKKLKNLKRVCPKRVIKGQKEWKGQTKWKYMNPKRQKETMKECK